MSLLEHICSVEEDQMSPQAKLGWWMTRVGRLEGHKLPKARVYVGTLRLGDLVRGPVLGSSNIDRPKLIKEAAL